MRRNKPAYSLNDIKRVFRSASTLNVTRSALDNAEALGMTRADMVDLIQSLDRADFHKSMPSNLDPQVRQDVYFAATSWGKVYVKFTAHTPGAFLLLSFKEP